MPVTSSSFKHVMFAAREMAMARITELNTHLQTHKDDPEEVEWAAREQEKLKAVFLAIDQYADEMFWRE